MYALRKRVCSFSLVTLTVFGFTGLTAGTALAQTWRLTGPPVFVLDGSGDIMQPGASRSYSSITTTLNSRTLSSAAFTTTDERWGTSSITYSWDSPPAILRTGDVVPFSIRWNIGQRWSRFSPQMGSLAHLDWSTNWYTTQCYGELCPSSPTSGQERNTAITVTSNNSTQLVFYVEVHSTPGAVRVQWTYRQVDGSAPPSPGTPGAVTTAPSHPNSPATPPRCAQESIIYTTGNIAGVLNGPTQPTRFQLNEPTVVTSLMSYHWNNGRGQPPGTVFLRHQDGTTYGGQASSAPGQGGVPTAYWMVRPNVVLKSGIYTVIDSHPSTWAQNAQSNGQGIVEVKGCSGP